jgi:hypothetical protein
MTFTALRAAARHRLARMRGVPSQDDSGFALVFVLLVTMIIMMGVSSMLMVTASNVTPASNSQSSESALAAAESGIQYYAAYLNANCTTFNGAPCSAISGTPTGPTTVAGADGNGTAESYTTTVLNPTTYLDDGFLRVKSTGKAGSSTRTLIADLKGLPDLLRYAYLSKYETLDPDFLAAYYGPHSIKISNDSAGAAAAAAANSVSPALSKNSQINWNAPSTTAGTTGNVNVCQQLWYGSGGRAEAKASYDASLPLGTDWSTTGKVASSGQSVTMYQPCEVTFSSGMTFDGPVYSEDSLYLSYGTFNGSGPTFAVPTRETLPPASTGSTSTDPGQTSDRLYRQFPGVLGGPSKNSTGYATGTTVQHSAYDLQLPPNANDATATCTYTGPTRIVVSGSTATVTSPMTPTGASPCYTTDGTGPGVAGAKVPIATAVISIVNKGSSSSWGTASPTKPILANAVATSTTPSGSDASTFKNEQGQTYTSFASQLQSAQAANLTSSSPKSLDSLANGLLNDTGAPILGVGSPQYQAVGATGTASQLDPLESSAVSAVTIQRRTCLLALLGACVSLSPWSSMFTVSVTSGTFPVTGDVTQYPTWNASSPGTSTAAPGDVYIEGTGVSGKLSVVAQHDIVVTGPLTTAGTPGTNSRGEPAWQSGDGAIDLVADNNVRVYHPVSCAVTSVSNPSAGYCPNDITGLYNESNPPSSVITSSGGFGTSHPAMQYCNMTTGSDSSNCSGVTKTGSGAVTAIDAGIFALGGSLMTDNFNRGKAMGPVTVTGGIYQLHRGAIGQQWEIQANGTSRASSGYALQDNYLDLGPAGLMYVPSPLTGSSSTAWSIVSVSSAAAGSS